MQNLTLIPGAVEQMLTEVALSTGPWLTLLVIFPAIVALVIWLVPGARAIGRQLAFWSSVAMLVAFILMAIWFDWGASGITQFVESYFWVPQIGLTWSLGVNALSLVMLLLTAVLVPLVLAASKSEDQDPSTGGSYAALIMSLYGFIVVIFAAFDLLVFYIAFEAMLIPVFFMIGRFGRGENRNRAALKFLIYSLFGGLVMLGGVIAIFAQVGSAEGLGFRFDTLAYILPLLSPGWQLAIFLPIFIAFAIKAPMVPVHTWLPDTAAVARPGTSVLLVGILDKIGTYGMIMILLFMLPGASETVRPVIVVLAVISILWGGFAANGQKNLLRLVSFTSISHFGFIVLGIFIGSSIALTGAMFFMVAHGLSIAGLFLLSGFLIERGGTSSVFGYGGMQRVTPVLAGMWLFAGLASIALPGLSGFVPEYLVLMGTYEVNIALAIFAVFGVILAALYILMPYQRIFTGRINPEMEGLPDLNDRQKWVVSPLLAGMLILGIWSAPLVGSLAQISEESPLLHYSVDASTAVDSAASSEGNAK